MNNSRRTSLGQTMAQMRRRYAARSSGGSAAPYAPYTGEMPVENPGDDQMVEPPNVVLTLTGPDTVTRGRRATYTASITTEEPTLDSFTFNWTYTTTVREGQDPELIEESIDAPPQDPDDPQNPQTTTWSGTMVSDGTLEVSVTVNGRNLVQTMDVTVNKRPWVTMDLPICKDTTSLGVEAPHSHTDLGDVEYDICFSPANDLKTAKVDSGPNNGIWYITYVKLTAPLVAKINRHFRMAEADSHESWVAFKNANTRYSEIEGKIEARLGADGMTSRTLYGSWKIEIGYNDPKADLEEFMALPLPSKRQTDYDNENRLLYENQIVDRVELLRTSRKNGMATRISGWSPTGITINYNYFAAHAGRDQTVGVGSTVNFDGSRSAVPQGREVRYTWNFDSGADPDIGEGDKPNCIYNTPGEKTVTLTVTDTGDDTDIDPVSDTVTVTVKEPLRRHPDIPVGMRGIQDEQLTELEKSFHSIYVGDSISSHPACNYLHSYGHNFDVNNPWGLSSGYFAISDDDSDSDMRNKRSMRHAKAWRNFVGSVRNVNDRLGGAKLKCLISNRLMWMHLVEGWHLDDISRYVRQTIHEIDRIIPTRVNPNPKDIVAGWYFGDDALHPTKTNYTVDKVRKVVETVHCAQKACGVNWPFYFSSNLDDAPFWNKVTDNDGNETGEWKFAIPQILKDWIGAFPPDATPVFMSYYYAWLSNNWDYFKDPPWKKWKMYIEELNKAFFNPDDTAKIHPNLKFHPVLDASEHMTNRVEMEMEKEVTIREPTGLPLPGHADMHKQVRVVWNLLKKYRSVSGIWFLGWNSDDGVAGSRGTAHNNWTTNRRWAEAIQNEPHETEGIREAIPASNAILENFPEPLAVPTAADIKAGNRTITRIPYHLAERCSFTIEIRRPRNPETPDVEGKLIRTIDEGYTGKSPPGRFANSNGTEIGEPASMVLNGTSAHWDGNKQDNTPADNGTYEAFLVVNDTTYGPITITKAPPRQNDDDASE